MVNNKVQDFEEFLAEVHHELHPETLDDDMSDAFDNWLGQLDGEEYIEYGNKFGLSIAKRNEALLEVSTV
jgi:hypothetical protein